MTHVIETATTGRAKCRGCGQQIAKGELRIGERQPNVFGDGEMTLWFHPACAAYKRPQTFLEVLAAGEANELTSLKPAAEHGAAHRRLPRVDGAERAPTGRARCRHCGEPIERGTWRIPLVFFEEFRFQPSGFVHAGCAKAYFGTDGVLDRVRHFSPALTDEDVADLERALATR